MRLAPLFLVSFTIHAPIMAMLNFVSTLGFLRGSPILKYLHKCRLFRPNRVKTSESLRLCRLFKIFHPAIEKRFRKDAYLQEFHYLAYSQVEKDAYLQEFGDVYGRV
ncbi:hypothetical protein BC351_05280 [Paenibacillus ferrarius]|uniref:Uncharacterized protein n=1 Tax=Paenibacillus ferrarius TaxID=1469647 RepID=A0A1V4HFC3_9BACL|nr:hypothetical protein BC351_05280 [Paenibacillus ferrarius]